ncbi:MAG TPA: transaldolase family protein, partial [Rhabdaerophilum sp.]|nr:transaldolase family protein [Rhabdaerophilum sp.]
ALEDTSFVAGAAVQWLRDQLGIIRTSGEIEALAGCDRLTIAPALLDQLAKDESTLARVLDAAKAAAAPKPARIPTDEASFRWHLNEDAMATEKLAEGIRLFAADLNKLKAMLAKRLGAA